MFTVFSKSGTDYSRHNMQCNTNIYGQHARTQRTITTNVHYQQSSASTLRTSTTNIHSRESFARTLCISTTNVHSRQTFANTLRTSTTNVHSRQTSTRRLCSRLTLKCIFTVFGIIIAPVYNKTVANIVVARKLNCIKEKRCWSNDRSASKQVFAVRTSAPLYKKRQSMEHAVMNTF